VINIATVSVRKTVLGLVLAVFLWGSAGTVYAQQETGQAAPPTRNPQPNALQPFDQQKGSIQPTSPQQLLTQPVTGPTAIVIPPGIPAQKPSNPAQKKQSQWLTLSAAGLLVAAVLLTLSRHLPSEETKAPAAKATESAKADKKNPKKPKSSAKKSRKKRKK